MRCCLLCVCAVGLVVDTEECDEGPRGPLGKPDRTRVGGIFGRESGAAEAEALVRQLAARGDTLRGCEKFEWIDYTHLPERYYDPDEISGGWPAGLEPWTWGPPDPQSEGAAWYYRELAKGLGYFLDLRPYQVEGTGHTVEAIAPTPQRSPVHGDPGEPPGYTWGRAVWRRSRYHRAKLGQPYEIDLDVLKRGVPPAPLPTWQVGSPALACAMYVHWGARAHIGRVPPHGAAWPRGMLCWQGCSVQHPRVDPAGPSRTLGEIFADLSLRKPVQRANGTWDVE